MVDGLRDTSPMDLMIYNTAGKISCIGQGMQMRMDWFDSED